MTERNTYAFTVTSDNRIPAQVLTEHLQDSVRQLRHAGNPQVELFGFHEPKPHPFDDPTNVVFDDEPAPGEIDHLDPYPLTTRVLDALRSRGGGHGE